MQKATFRHRSLVVGLFLIHTVALGTAHAKEPTEPWRIVSTEPSKKAPIGDDKFVVVLKEPYPLKVTLEVTGLYPGLPDVHIDKDFQFFEKSGGDAIEPLQVVSPDKIPPEMVGNGKQNVRFEVYLADYSSNAMFGPIVQRGYLSSEIVFSYKGGKKQALPASKPGNASKPPK
jgi:hypothetical protein